MSNLFFLKIQRPPRSTLFPYTTLFRPRPRRGRGGRARGLPGNARGPGRAAQGSDRALPARGPLGRGSARGRAPLSSGIIRDRESAGPEGQGGGSMNEGTRVRLRRALAALALVAGAVPGGQAAAKPSFADLVANLKS